MKTVSAPIRKQTGFSLVEVILAIGVLTVSVLALIGLLAPPIGQVSHVVGNARAMSTVSKVNAALQAEDFDDVFGWVQQNEAARDGDYTQINSVIYAFQALTVADDPDADDEGQVRSVIVMPDETIPGQLGNDELIDGEVFVVLFTPSPLAYEDTTARTPLLSSYSSDASDYPRAYLPMNMMILSQSPDDPTNPDNLIGQPGGPTGDDLRDVVGRNTIIDYPTAINR